MDPLIGMGVPVCLGCRRGFRLVDLESGEGSGRGAGDLGDQAIVVVDPPGGVYGFDGQRLSGVDDAGMVTRRSAKWLLTGLRRPASPIGPLLFRSDICASHRG